jgi:hypothetical protein
MSLDLLTNLKEFEKLLKICRKQGVTDISFGEVSLKLGEMPRLAQEESDEFPTDELTPEQLMFYAAGQGAQ